MLPVDAYYETEHFKLVIEYRERQHSESVPFFDLRRTRSGCDRATQRRLYDQRRRDVLPRYGIDLVELSYELFRHDRKKRLCRDAALDEAVVRQRLAQYVKWGE